MQLLLPRRCVSLLLVFRHGAMPDMLLLQSGRRTSQSRVPVRFTDDPAATLRVRSKGLACEVDGLTARGEELVRAVLAAPVCVCMTS